MLSADFTQLMKAGILHRFPGLFPEGTVTWDTWVWAAASWMSRSLPAECYLRKMETLEVAGQAGRSSLAESEAAATVFGQLGVLIPLLDMANHEAEAAQITWKPASSRRVDSVADRSDLSEFEGAIDHPRAVVHTKIKKGGQVYNSYGPKPNQHLVFEYGFAQVANNNDELVFSWGLGDGVGNVPIPEDYLEYVKGCGSVADFKSCIFESSDPDAIRDWWTDDRLYLLEKHSLSRAQLVQDLKNGKKLSVLAHANAEDDYYPYLLGAAVVATMSTKEVVLTAKRFRGEESSSGT
ncbi:MAG: hypothetical protein ACRDL7_08935, partial [Gaiellaceae bacterium]